MINYALEFVLYLLRITLGEPLYETIRRLYYAQDDGQSSQSNPAFYTPAFYTPAYYPLSRTFLPHFLSRLLPVVTPASRTLALPLFTHSL